MDRRLHECRQKSEEGEEHHDYKVISYLNYSLKIIGLNLNKTPDQGKAHNKSDQDNLCIVYETEFFIHEFMESDNKIGRAHV